MLVVCLFASRMVVFSRVVVRGCAQPVWPIAKRSAAMDNSSDDKISSIVSSNTDFYYKHFIEESSNSESKDDFDLIAITAALHKDNEAQLHQWKGLSSQIRPQPTKQSCVI
jgi:hypothetical protein